jgi:hypothetical protein
MHTVAAYIPKSRIPGVSETTDRLGLLLNDRQSVAQWWVDLAAQLDELAGRLLIDGQEVWRSISDQITADAPHMTSQLRRLDAEQDALEAELFRVRMLAGEAAGDPERAMAITTAVRDLLFRIRRHGEGTSQALYDAYERDLGGESA